MKNFSSIKNTSVETSKDHLLNQMVQTTGLPKERVKKLFESFEANSDGTLDSINEGFKIFAKSKTFSYADVEEVVNTAAKAIAKKGLDISKMDYKRIMVKMIHDLKKFLTEDIGLHNILKITILILAATNNKQFGNLVRNYSDAEKISKLFENYELTDLNESEEPVDLNETNLGFLGINKDKFKKIGDLFTSTSEALLKNKKVDFSKIEARLKKYATGAKERMLSMPKIFQLLLIIGASKYGYKKLKSLFESEDLEYYDELFESATGLDEKKLAKLDKVFKAEIKNIPEDEKSFKEKTDNFIKKVESILGLKMNVMNALKFTAIILALQNHKKFSDVLVRAETGARTSNLFRIFESVELNKDENIELFESLRDILHKNKSNWGYNYHLDNTYQAIVSYLDNEITEITNKDNIETASNTYHWDIIRNFVTAKDIEPMYRSANVIKTLVPDIQTLVFDMMLLVHSYVNINRETMMFISRNSTIDYENATRNLYGNISSSLAASKIAYKNNPDCITETNTTYNLGIFDEFQLDNSEINFGEYPVTMNAALNMLHVVKACSGEFNLKIRGAINMYVTKALDLLVKSEKVIIAKTKIR